jgi:hypothetical protein
MNTLSYGYKQPNNTDTGDVIFPAMNANIAQLNGHNHDGQTSALVFNRTQAISPAGWVIAGGGSFTQDVVMPAGYLYDERIIQIRLSTGEPFYPTITRLSATSYRVTVNDNTLGLVAMYG